MKAELNKVHKSEDELERKSRAHKKSCLQLLDSCKKGKYPLDPVARFHLGNGASIYQLNVGQI